MKLATIHYRVVLEHYTYECDTFKIFTYNDSNRAYEKFCTLREWYKRLDEAQKSEICIKFQVCDRSISSEALLHSVVCAVGFNVMDGYILNDGEWEHIESRYFPEKLKPQQ